MTLNPDRDDRRPIALATSRVDGEWPFLSSCVMNRKARSSKEGSKGATGSLPRSAMREDSTCSRLNISSPSGVSR